MAKSSKNTNMFGKDQQQFLSINKQNNDIIGDENNSEMNGTAAILSS